MKTITFIVYFKAKTSRYWTEDSEFSSDKKAIKHAIAIASEDGFKAKVLKETTITERVKLK